VVRPNRTMALMGLLLALLLGYLSRPLWSSEPPRAAPALAPLPGENMISGLTVQKNARGTWVAEFDYFYTGAPRHARFSVELGPDATPTAAPAGLGRGQSGNGEPQRGAHRASVPISRPPVIEASVTRSVTVKFMAINEVLGTQHVAKTIAWPDILSEKWQSEYASKGPDALLARAVELIDRDHAVGDDSDYREAGAILNLLVSQDSRYVPAYIELARVAMRTNWGPEGLHQAETLLDSALQLQPASVNAKILQGYVYAHQGRYQPAEKLLREAAVDPPGNMWLWSNWGELLAMQGKVDEAIVKYREALAVPRSTAANDRARADAYAHLLGLLEARNDVAAQELLQKRRALEFGPGSCYSIDYARFLMQQRGDFASGLAQAREAVDGRCMRPDARNTLGLAYYAAWSGEKEPARANLLNQARVFLPAGPLPLYMLARSERTMAAARQLIESGEAVDLRDNQKFTALAHALQYRDHGAAQRLIQLGARTDALVGPGDMPIALLPVMQGDVLGVKLMRKAGVDYGRLRYNDARVIDEVRRSGNRQLLEAMDPKLRGA
jgi:tetratricopeptide (TPR) repeat protein